MVVLYHREEHTRRMFEQLAKVTEGYSLIIVNNGFDDPGFIESLNPLHYVENEENTGAIRGMNQGLELAEGKYVAVLHNDILIFEEGWLDHIIEFMEKRPDVGLVGLMGAHTIKKDGNFEFETNVVPCEGWCPRSLRPTWRFVEVATIDGVCWVMRNTGILLDESFGMFHGYDLDLPLQHIEAGHRVYVMPAEFAHLIHDDEGYVDLARSSRGQEEYLYRIGGDDEKSAALGAERLRHKWRHMLPITRGFRDEAYAYLREAELRKEILSMREHLRHARDTIDSLSRDNSRSRRELDRAGTYIEGLRWRERELRLENERVRMQIEKRGGTGAT